MLHAENKPARLPATCSQNRHEGCSMLAFEIIGAVFIVMFLAALVGGNDTVPGQ
jgi:hypothetical protein